MFENSEKITLLEKIAHQWQEKILDWNLHASLPVDLELADGKRIDKSRADGFYDHGTNFGKFFPMQFSMTIPDVEKVFPNSNLLAVLPYQEGNQEIVWYKFLNFKPRTDKDPRSGYVPANLYLLFEKGEGSEFVNIVKTNPSLIDLLIKIKFPRLVSDIEIKDWEKMLLLPANLCFKDFLTQVQVIASL